MTDRKTVGVPGAAKLLAELGATPTTEKGVSRAADAGLIPHTRDHGNRRVFQVDDLVAFAEQQKASTP